MIPPVWADAPRYGPDAPFPAYQYVPGGARPHPTRDPRGHSHGAEERADFARGVDLYHAGYLWEAHEAWEGCWKASEDPAERDLLQGLIQMAAALLKVHAQEERGARTLARRAQKRLARAPGTYRGLDVAGVKDAFARCFGRLLAGGGLAAVAWQDAPRLRLGGRGRPG